MEKEMNEFKWHGSDVLPSVGSEVYGVRYSGDILAVYKDEDEGLLSTVGTFKTNDIILEDNESGLVLIGSDCFGENWYKPWDEVIYWSYIPELPSEED